MQNGTDTIAPSSALPASPDYVEALYEDYLRDPASVPQSWRRVFDELPPPDHGERPHGPVVARFRDLDRASSGTGRAVAGGGQDVQDILKQHAIRQLIGEYRRRGHLRADVDPLGLRELPEAPSLDPAYHGLEPADLQRRFAIAAFPGVANATLAELLDALRTTYCGHIGWEHAYLSDTREVEWFNERIEPQRATPNPSTEAQLRLLLGLTAAEGLDRHLHRKYVGQKRFSLEGGDGLIPLLDTLICRAGAAGTRETVIGMAHRGRLNVLVNILGKRPRDLFSEFEGKTGTGQGSGDVKYHQGFSSDLVTPGGSMHVTLAFNPSHLEIINPVVEGSVRARQERRRDRQQHQVLPIQIHGDAAFAGQGVVMETLNLSKVRGFSTGGTLHIVINNQIGFTTSNPLDARSTLYCTDIAKLIQAPILHVNGDDPEALWYAAQLALDYRRAFQNDVVIDLVCYRRHGHNEADEPAITQPAMYRRIAAHPTPREIYRDQLLARGVLQEGEAEKLARDYAESLDGEHEVALCELSDVQPALAIDWAPYLNTAWTTPAKTQITAATVSDLHQRLSRLPPDFTLHPRVARVMADREEMARGKKPMDWGFAETLAYASLLMDGYRVRLSGQDSGRGTFSHRHAILHNQQAAQGAPERYVPLENLAPDQPSCRIIDSLLSEEAVLAFEFGYASADPATLVVWEAQFGDFANGAQVVIDQFISSSEAKWQRLCGLVMMLPHGYEGQGPEHSSARLERYLQLCAEHNMQVCVPSTPAQMFHLLRRQMVRPFRKPLIILSPKSLLRHKESVATLEQITSQGFQTVIADDQIDRSSVERVILCAGKVYYDLLAARREQRLDHAAIVRIEQLYPFPGEDLAQVLQGYPNADTLVWTQEEPQNQGAWYSSQHHFRACLRPGQTLAYAGRPPSAAPAGGYMATHLAEQQQLVRDALGQPRGKGGKRASAKRRARRGQAA